MNIEEEMAELVRAAREAVERHAGPNPTIEWRDPESRTVRGLDNRPRT